MAWIRKSTLNRSKVLIAVLVMLAVLPRGVSAQSGRQEQTRKLRAVLSNYEVIRMEPSEVNARVQASNRLKVQLSAGLLDFRIEQRNLLPVARH